MPDDLTIVLEWARKHGPADIENAACRVLGWIADATRLVDATLYGAESHGGGRTPQTLGASEEQEANEAQEAGE